MPKKHPSAERLMAAAALLPAPITRHADLARAIGEQHQTVKNWDYRGVSKGGAAKAQAALGINTTWILEGVQPMFVGRPPAESQSVQQQRKVIADAVTLVRYIEDMAIDPIPAEVLARLPMAAVEEIELNWRQGLGSSDLPAAGRAVIARIRSAGG